MTEIDIMIGERVLNLKPKKRPAEADLFVSKIKGQYVYRKCIQKTDSLP